MDDDVVAAVALVVFLVGVACLLLVRLLAPRKDSEGLSPSKKDQPAATVAESQSLEPATSTASCLPRDSSKPMDGPVADWQLVVGWGMRAAVRWARQPATRGRGRRARR